MAMDVLRGAQVKRTGESLPLAEGGIAVVVVDGLALSRSGLCSLFAGAGGIVVAGEAGNRREALQVVESASPHVVILDIDTDADGLLAMIPELTAASPATRVLVITGSRDRELHRRAVRLGAIGLLGKDSPPGVLVKAIERIYAGEVWLDRSLTASVLGELSRGVDSRERDPEVQHIALLTQREREVIAAIGAGLKNKQIAERLFISEVTVRHHLTSIYGKLELTSRLELIIFAYRHGLARIPR